MFFGQNSMKRVLVIRYIAISLFVYSGTAVCFAQEISDTPMVAKDIDQVKAELFRNEQGAISKKQIKKEELPIQQRESDDKDNKTLEALEGGYKKNSSDSSDDFGAKLDQKGQAEKLSDDMDGIDTRSLEVTMQELSRLRSVNKYIIGGLILNLFLTLGLIHYFKKR